MRQTFGCLNSAYNKFLFGKPFLKTQCHDHSQRGPYCETLTTTDEML